MTDALALVLKAPCCGKRLKPAALYFAATSIVRRSCRRCQLRYVVRIRPLKAGSHFTVQVHEVEWSEVA